MSNFRFVLGLSIPCLLSCVATSLALSPGSSIAAEPTYPCKPVRIIFPGAAGTSGEVRTRALAERLTARLGQAFYVEAKPGAGTTIGTLLAANAAPDGYTLLATFTPAFPVGPVVYKTAGYDPIQSFTPIGMFSRGSPFLIVPPTSPAKTLKEFVDLAKAKPRSLNVAHGGLGGAQHLPTELFCRAAGIQFLYVPYKGESLALPDLLGGRIDAMFAYTAMTVPQVKSGAVRALAVAGTKRNPALPEVPTFAEAGYPAFHYAATMLLLGPQGLPKHIVALLNREIASILKEPEVLAMYEAVGSEPVSGSPEDAAALIKREIDLTGSLVKELGISMDQ
jgi:tripartite-type tricarboxylate transporter receptor subunit TctC